MASEGDGAAPARARAADLLSVDALRRYLQAACAPLFFESAALEADAILRGLAGDSAAAALEQFVGDSAARVLQVHCLPAARDDGDSPMDGTGAVRIRVNVGIEYAPDGKKSAHDVVCFIKRFSAPLTKDQTLNHQLQVMTLGLGAKTDGDKKADAASASGDNTEEEDDDRGNLLSVVYNYVHQSFGPLVNEYSKVHQAQNEVATLGDNARGTLVHGMCARRMLY
jgi:hypothetical protein